MAYMRFETYAKPYQDGGLIYPLGGACLGAIALVTLIRSSEDNTSAAELIEEIRTAIKSSKISKEWSIEKISILGESGTLAPDLPQAAKETHPHGD